MHPSALFHNDAALITADGEHLSPSYTRHLPLVVHRAQGCYLYSANNQRYLDFSAGLAVCSTGHAHPKVVAAITQQAQRFLHVSSSDFYFDLQVELAQQMKATLPHMGTGAKVYFGCSGAEATEAAMKLARYHTGRPSIIGFYNSFHGRSYGALSLTNSQVKYRQGMGPFLPNVFHAPYPQSEAAVEHCLHQLEHQLLAHTVPPSEVAAIIVEPIQGEGGYFVAPPAFLLGLQALCRRHGMLLVSDEVQSGVGRTGRFWAGDHVAGWEPDVVLSAKGLASGLPLCAVVAKEGVMNWPAGAHAATFGGNPLSCAAALATLAVLKEEALLENAAAQGEVLSQGLQALAKAFPAAQLAVRGRGLMLALEAGALLPAHAHLSLPQQRDALLTACFERGLVLVGCGAQALRLCPPLVLNTPQSQEALAILQAVLTASR